MSPNWFNRHLPQPERERPSCSWVHQGKGSHGSASNSSKVFQTRTGSSQNTTAISVMPMENGFLASLQSQYSEASWGRIAECDPRLVSEQRPRFAAHEKALENALLSAVQNKPRRRVVLVVDGIDHVTRVINSRTAIDPSFALAEALAALRLPPGTTMIVLSQPGKHLNPFETTRVITAQIPPLSEAELWQLAVKLNVLADRSNGSRLSGASGLLKDEEAVDEFVTTLAERSAGNALYATYLCREALGKAATIAEPSVTVRSLPQFDGSLRAYYEHLQRSLGDQSAWVADVIALLDFPVSRNELKEICPDMTHSLLPVKSSTK